MTYEETNIVIAVIEEVEKLTNFIFHDRLSLLMDIDACNETYPLDYEALSKTNMNNKVHDIFGINMHFNRSTRTLTEGFVPRCVRR